MPDTSQLLSQFYVKLDGADVSEMFMRDLMEITVENSLHLPDVATLVLHDPHLLWIDADSLAPGKTVNVSARGPKGEKLIFDGEIVELEPDFHPTTQILTVRAFDRIAPARNWPVLANVYECHRQRSGEEAGTGGWVKGTGNHNDAGASACLPA